VLSLQSAHWESELLDLAEDCPQLLHLHDVLCRGEADWLPDLQDRFQWIAEEGSPIKPEFGVEIELETKRENER